MNRKMLAGFLGIAMLLAGSLVSGAGQSSPKSSQKTPRQRLAERSFPNVTLTTHDGKKVKFYDDLLKDKIVLINFMYVKCEGICPGTTANLVKVQKLLGDRMGKDIFMYSITLKPEEDSAKDLAEYARAYKVGPGWKFLTGSPKDIDLLRRKLGFIDRDPVRDANKSNHIGMLRWGNEPHTMWSACPAMLAPAKIVKELSLVDWPTAERPRAEAQEKRETRGGER